MAKGAAPALKVHNQEEPRPPTTATMCALTSNQTKIREYVEQTNARFRHSGKNSETGPPSRTSIGRRLYSYS